MQQMEEKQAMGSRGKVLPSLGSRQDFQSKLTQNRSRKVHDRKKFKPIKTVSLTFEDPDPNKENGVKIGQGPAENGVKGGQGHRDAAKVDGLNDQRVDHQDGQVNKVTFSDNVEHINGKHISVSSTTTNVNTSQNRSTPVLQMEKLNEEFQRFMAKETSDSQSDTTTNRSSLNAPPANITINLYLNNDNASGALSPRKVLSSSTNQITDLQISRSSDVVSIKQSQEVRDKSNFPVDYQDQTELNEGNEPDILVLEHGDTADELALHFDDDDYDNSECDDSYEGMPEAPSPGKRRRSSNWSQYGESITDDVVAEFHSLSQDALNKKQIKKQELRHRMTNLPTVDESPRGGQLLKVEHWLNHMHHEDESLNGTAYEDGEDDCNESQNGLHYSQDSLADSVFGDHYMEPHYLSNAKLEHHYSLPEPPSFEAPKHKAEIFRRSGAKDPQLLVMLNRSAYESTNPDLLLGKPPTPHAWLAEPKSVKNNKTLPPIAQDNAKVPFTKNEEHVRKTRHQSLSPINGDNGDNEHYVQDYTANGFQGFGYTMQGQPHWKRATIDTHINVSALQNDLSQVSESMPHMPHMPHPPLVPDSNLAKDAATQYEPQDNKPVAMETNKAGGQSIDVQVGNQVNPCVENDSGFWSTDENNVWEDQDVYVVYLQTESGALIGPMKLELESLQLGLPDQVINGPSDTILTEQEEMHSQNDINVPSSDGNGPNLNNNSQNNQQTIINSNVSDDDSVHHKNDTGTYNQTEQNVSKETKAQNGHSELPNSDHTVTSDQDQETEKNMSDINGGESQDISLSGKNENSTHGAHSNGKLKQGSVPGLRNRQTGSNSVNEHSSRSHSMLTLQIDSEAQDPDDENLYITKHGKLTFVDLAGSEKVKNETSASAGHLLESNNINKSLLVLGNCIAALGDAKRKTGHIPYRDSKLTKLLADSLGGNGVTLMIACVSPSACNSFESLNTLRYANRAKRIKTKPVVKMDPREKLILSLKREVKVLRQENHYLRQQLEFPVKPRGQLQKENDEKFLKMIKDQEETGIATVTDHGLYEMLQEYMIENETLRNENSDLHHIKDQSKRDQQLLAIENEKLIRKLDDMERERYYAHTPVSIYSVNSSRHGSATDHGQFYNGRLSQGPGPPWGYPPEQLSRNSTSDSWHSYQLPGYDGQNGQSNGFPPPGGSRRTTPPAGIPQRKKPPHRLAEPIKSPRYDGPPQAPGPPGGGYAARFQQQVSSPRDGYASPRGGIPGPTRAPQGPPPNPQGPPPRGHPSNGQFGQGPPPGHGPPPPQQQYSQPQQYPQQRMPPPAAQQARQDPPMPQPRKSKGSQGSSHSSVSIPSDHGSATLSTSGSVAESTQEMNERLKRELMDLEGEIHSHTKQIQQPRKPGPR